MFDAFSKLLGKFANDSSLNKLKLGLKDKICIILGEVGVGKTTFINAITKPNEEPKLLESSGSKSCTTDIDYRTLFDDGYNFYFVDTPGLNDSKGDLKNIDIIKKIRNKGIITSFILIRKYTDMRLTNSFSKVLKQFMEIFPSENFLEHVILVETFYYPEMQLTKDEFIKSIKDDKELFSYMKEKNIKIPDEIKTFQIELKIRDNEHDFTDILYTIKDMHPLYKKYAEFEEPTISETKILGNETVMVYKLVKHITYTDFENNTKTKDELIDQGYFPQNNILPELTVVEREKTQETRSGSFPFCWTTQYHIKYWSIKTYKINEKKYQLKTLQEETWEKNDEVKGETYRRKIENDISHHCNI